MCVQHALTAVTVWPLLPPPLFLPAGLLTSGLIPSVRHAMDGLLTSDAILLPASATVYMQAVRRGVDAQLPSRRCDLQHSVHCALCACARLVRGVNPAHFVQSRCSGGAAYGGGVRPQDVCSQPVSLAPRLCNR